VAFTAPFPSISQRHFPLGGGMFEWIARLWCKRAHTRPMWPIHGRYTCAKCLRQHPVAWDRTPPRQLRPFSWRKLTGFGGEPTRFQNRFDPA
jgi:hypothetical protein